MKYFYTLFSVFFSLFLWGCGDSDKPKLVMVTTATFPPYEYIQKGEIDGIDPCIIKTISERLGYQLEIRDMSFDSVIAAVQSGKADIAASGITVTEERKKQINFTLPYVISKQVIIVPVNSEIKKSSDLNGKKIGVQHGTTGDMYVTEKFGDPERYSHGPLAVAALKAAKIDAVIVDSEPAEVYIAQNKNLHILNEPLTYEEYAFAISRENTKLLEDFNLELRKMKDSGELKKIIDSYKQAHSKDAENHAKNADTFFGRMKESFELNFIKDNRYKYLLDGFINTIIITFFALLLGIAIGFGVAIIRSTADLTGKLKIADFFCKIYLTVIRGTPVVVQLLIIYFVIFGSVDIDKLFVAVIAFGINSGAYVAEIVRSGIMSIDKGQMEAGRSLGLSYSQTMNLVILPQAFKNVLPALGNEFIVLLKETSVAGYIALADLTKGGDIIRSQTYDAFLPLAAVALIYLIVVVVLSKLLGILEKRLKQNE